MPVLSKIASPDHTDDDYVSETQDMLSLSPSLTTRSGLSSHGPGPFRFFKSVPANASHPPGSNVSFRHSGSGIDSHQRPRHTLASEDRRSHSYISVSSDSPGVTTNELVELRKENVQLQVECGRLEGQITILK